MSKPTSSNSSNSSNSSTTAPEKLPEKVEKLSPAQRAAVMVGRMIGRAIQVEAKIAGYSKEIGEGLGNARRWLETAKAAAEKLPPGFRPASAKPTNPNITVGVFVVPRDKRRETYAAVLTTEELTKGIPVQGIHGSMLSVMTSRGLSFIPKAHLKVAGATPAAQ